MAKVTACVFNTARDAERAVQSLLHSNIADDCIGVVVHNREVGPGIADDLGREYRSGMNPPADEITSPSDVYESIPGGFVKALQGDGTPPETLNWFTSQVNAGKIMVIVNDESHLSDAQRILHDNGCMDYGAGMKTPTTGAAMQTTPTATTTPGNEFHVPVIDEEVVVERTTHQVGEVEVTSETSSETVDIPTTFTHEEIRVERHKLDHPVHPNDYSGVSGEKGVIRMPVVEEEIHVTKTPIVREELVITRVPVTERQTLHETVMHAEPLLDTHGDVDIEDVNKKGTMGGGEERPAA